MCISAVFLPSSGSYKVVCLCAFPLLGFISFFVTIYYPISLSFVISNIILCFISSFFLDLFSAHVQVRASRGLTNFTFCYLLRNLYYQYVQICALFCLFRYLIALFWVFFIAFCLFIFICPLLGLQCHLLPFFLSALFWVF